MNILFFSDHFWPEPSAPAAHVYERAKIWARQGHQVTVICSAPNFPDGHVYKGYKNRIRNVEIIDGIRVVRVWTYITANEGFFLRTLDYCSYAISAFLNAWFEKRPDVIISTSPHLFVPMGGMAHAKLRLVPHVFEIRDLWPASILSTGAMKPGWAYRILECLELLLYKHSSRVISLTHSFVGDIVRRGVPEDKVDVVVNGTNLDLFGPRERDAEIEEAFGLKGRFVVGYLGTVGMASGLQNLIRVAKLLKGSGVIFFIVGVGAIKEELQTQVTSLQLDNVVFAPRQLREEMPRFWSVVHAGLVHLRNDPVFSTVIPSKIFESMGMGRPILYIAPRGEGSRIVEQHQAGLIVDPDDPKKFAEAVLKLRDNPSLLATFSANSLAAATNFSREKQAERTLESLEKAVAYFRVRNRA